MSALETYFLLTFEGLVGDGLYLGATPLFGSFLVATRLFALAAYLGHQAIDQLCDLQEFRLAELLENRLQLRRPGHHDLRELHVVFSALFQA